jgi:hypothetical protein
MYHLRRLTFELRRPPRVGAWAASPMICTAGSRPKCQAVEGRLERRVRPRSHACWSQPARNINSGPTTPATAKKTKNTAAYQRRPTRTGLGIRRRAGASARSVPRSGWNQKVQQTTAQSTASMGVATDRMDGSETRSVATRVKTDTHTAATRARDTPSSSQRTGCSRVAIWVQRVGVMVDRTFAVWPRFGCSVHAESADSS